jgi:hypothetical protein
MGSAKKKRSHAPTVRDKNILNLYNKLHEIVSLLAELLHIQLMTDTTVLHLSTLGKFYSLIILLVKKRFKNQRESVVFASRIPDPHQKIGPKL